MDWYSLFVLTGKEEYVEERLRECFREPLPPLISLIPKRKLTERKQGKVAHTIKKMFPGYILIHTEMNPEVYYALKKYQI
jgi:transcriptional antiterminator NusG